MNLNFGNIDKIPSYIVSCNKGFNFINTMTTTISSNRVSLTAYSVGTNASFPTLYQGVHSFFPWFLYLYLSIWSDIHSQFDLHDPHIGDAQ